MVGWIKRNEKNRWMVKKWMDKQIYGWLDGEKK